MIKNVVFDLGGVLVDWDPRYMYRTVFETDVAMEYFLSNVCTTDWNEEQDGGRPISDANAVLIAKYPQYRAEIEAFYGRWTEMLGGPIHDMVEVLQQIHRSGKYRLLALTNWSAETWPIAVERYEFLNSFEGILVSGVERLKKPNPAIYQLLFSRYEILPKQSVFIDDNLRNIKAASRQGLQTVHHTSSETTMKLLRKLSVI